MKGIIIYKGKYGATEQYANWLSEELKLPAVSAELISGRRLSGYDFFLIGSSVYIGKLQIQKWLRTNLEFIKGRPIFVFQVAGTPSNETETRQVYNKNSIPAETYSNCRFYFLNGRLVINELSWKDRFMLKIGARLTKDPAVKKTMLTDYDDVKKENISGIIAAVKQLMLTQKAQSKQSVVLR